ncbi:MAG: beta-ketoacyl-[acyl-carrier-protein] synthase family protein [Nitrososphaerales archaeon]
MTRVVVTGLGIVSPLGIGVKEHWTSVISARSAITRSERLAERGFPVNIAAEVPAQALEAQLHRLPRKQLKFFSRVMLFGMIGSSLAVEDGGLKQTDLDPTRYGVFLATFFTSMDLDKILHWMTEAESRDTRGRLDFERANSYGMASMNPVDFSLKTMPNLAAGHIAIGHNAMGFCRVIADGFTGGLRAIGQAYLEIKEGLLDVALCGGAEAPLEDFVFINLCTINFLANGDESDLTCNPFDARRRGAVLGEGAGMLVLEEREHAIRRGAKIYGEVLGFGCSAGDTDISRQSAEGDHSSQKGVSDRLSLAMRSALADAAFDRVDLIAANGDSTVLHDLAETQAIKGVFGAAAKGIPICATKAMHGHLVSGSGAVEMITCLLALGKGIIPPTINSKDPDPYCDLDYVPNIPRLQPNMKTAIVNAVGLFGESASIAIMRDLGE